MRLRLDGVLQPVAANNQHLKVLHEAGLLDREKRGTWVYYRVRRPLRSRNARLPNRPIRANSRYSPTTHRTARVTMSSPSLGFPAASEYGPGSGSARNAAAGVLAL